MDLMKRNLLKEYYDYLLKALDTEEKTVITTKVYKSLIDKANPTLLNPKVDVVNQVNILNRAKEVEEWFKVLIHSIENKKGNSPVIHEEKVIQHNIEGNPMVKPTGEPVQFVKHSQPTIQSISAPAITNTPTTPMVKPTGEPVKLQNGGRKKTRKTKTKTKTK
jgi:hypothetical protein